MKIALACDKGGYRDKEAIKEMLVKSGHIVLDLGTTDLEHPVTHTEAATAVAEAIQKKEAEKGILLCGTGAGVCITANKFKGVHAVVVESEFAARHCKMINDCNVMCLGGYIVGEYMAVEMAKAFILAEFAYKFEDWRRDYLKKQIECIENIERENFK